MKKKVFMYYLVLIIIGVTITGFFTSELAQRYYKHAVEENLVNSASLIKYQLSEALKEGRITDYDLIARTYSRVLNQSSRTDSDLENINVRITFIDFEGKVLGDSEANYRKMSNHKDRQEVKEAIKGKTGVSSRYSQTLKVNFLYLAMPVKSPGLIVRVSVPLVHLKKINETIWYYTGISVILGLVLTSLLALRFSSQVTRPVKEFTRVSREFSSGNYSKRVYISSKDEFKQLADTFNKMAGKLEDTIADLTDKNMKVDSIINNLVTGILAVDRNFNIVLVNSVVCDLFDIKYGPGVMGINVAAVIRNQHINELLKETIVSNKSLVDEITMGASNEKVLRIHSAPIKSIETNTTNKGGIISIQDITSIKKLEQMRTEFVSNVTHELKTPLTSIRGFVETLREGAINDRTVAEKFLQIIDIEAERLYVLINDILQLSEIEMKQKDTNMGLYDLKSIVSETFTILNNAAEKKGITLVDDVNSDVMVYANADRVKQMLINLVDNAVKYNYEKGTVTVKAYKDKDNSVIIVKDTGIGISAENIPRIFERFYRVDKGRSRSMGGTGLGLSIVKHIVNLYNWDIKVVSEPGKGTEFIIHLPL